MDNIPDTQRQGFPPDPARSDPPNDHRHAGAAAIPVPSKACNCSLKIPESEAVHRWYPASILPWFASFPLRQMDTAPVPADLSRSYNPPTFRSFRTFYLMWEGRKIAPAKNKFKNLQM
jgi:hypothetical protein